VHARAVDRDPAAFFTDVHLWHLVITRMVSLTLQHGTTSESTLAYAWYGLVQGPTFRRYADGAVGEAGW